MENYLQAAEHLCPNCHTITSAVCAIHCCAICTMNCWYHTLLCQLYGELLVPYIAVSTVRWTVGAIHCCAKSTVNCWCHTLLCHLYDELLVPYIALLSVRCTFGAIHTTFFHRTSSTAVNCLVSQSALFCCLPFCSTQFLTPPTHHQNLTHFRKTYCCPQNGAKFLYGGSYSVVYNKMIDGAANYFFSKITSSWFHGQFRSVLAPLSTAHITFHTALE
jgi:hypothetical protein